MSKTKGNGIDPLWVLDGAPVEALPDYAQKEYPDGLPAMGTDALRFTLLTAGSPGNDLNLNLEKVESNRNFANKMWNVGRFVISAIDSLTSDSPLLQGEGARRAGEVDSPLAMGDGAQRAGEDQYTLADSWIWARLQQLIRDVERLFQTFQYGEAGRQIYDFFWGDFADWYLEIAKGQLANESTCAQTVDTLARVLDTSLRLLHPFTPFVTEELWGHLRSALRESPISSLSQDWPEALIVARWPEPSEPEGWEQEKIADFHVDTGSCSLDPQSARGNERESFKASGSNNCVR